MPQQTPSLDARARPIIEESLAASERLLNEGHSRRAVQEILWLLETIATAFRDTGPEDATVQGKYFVTIVKEMKAHGRGRAQEQILNWMTTRHGYLSSPTGGGVRHRVDLKSGIAIQAHEARLYCNLIRSYITYLIEEHERRTQVPFLLLVDLKPLVWIDRSCWAAATRIRTSDLASARVSPRLRANCPCVSRYITS